MNPPLFPLTATSRPLKVTSVPLSPWVVFFIDEVSPPSGTLWNMKASLPVARQAQTISAVVATLSSCLDMDAGTLIPELKQAEEDRLSKTAAASGTEEQAAAELHEEVMEDEEEAPPSKKNGKAAKTDNDFSDLLPVSCPTVECYGNPTNSDSKLDYNIQRPGQ